MSNWVEEQPDAYLFCRDTTLGHPWEPFSAEQDEDGTVWRISECSRCLTRKRTHVGPRGERKKSKPPEYPEGYLRKGLGRVTKEENAEVRLEASLRLLDPAYNPKPKRARKKAS